MKKRILASLLSLVMVLSMFQTALAAEGFTPADEPQQDEAVCICDALCTEEMVNTDCPVCGGEAGYTACAGTVSEPTQDEDNGIPADEGNSAPETDKLLTKENVYKVGDAQDLTNALDEIAKSDAVDATIVLTSNITNANFAGVVDKHVTLKSDGDTLHTITLASELVGDLTADNVKVSAGTLYCSGHRTIFTENCEFTITNTLYGGGNKKTVKSTYVKINGTGKINTTDNENVVIGGSYKGSVEGDIYIELAGEIRYGSNEGGNYLAATNKGTSYGGDTIETNLYVGGNVTLILDGPVDTMPQNVIGAYNSHVKGNVTVQVKAGYFNGINGMREDSDQSIVDGDIHIIAGDPAYEGGDRICRLNSNWDITGAGEQINNSGLFQVKGDVTIDTYENVWGWDKDGTPNYDPPGIVGADSAEVGGDVTINVRGSHLEDITGVDESLVSGSLVKGNVTINATNAELKDADNTSYIYPISDGEIKGNATINMDGGSVTQINCSVGSTVGNTTVNITGEPKFTSQTYGVWGQNVTADSARDKSVLNFDKANTAIPIVGYFSEMNVINNSDVTLGNEKKNAFGTLYDVNINTGAKLTTNKQAYSKGALTMDHGTWIANGFLYVTKTTDTQDSELVMHDYAAFGYGHKDDAAYDQTVVTSSGDTYTFNKCNYIDKIYGNAEITGSTWNVFVPTIIGGNYKGTTNQLYLPAFAENENYPDEKIPLEILGTATGATQVTLVDKTNTENEGLPIVGQNYINALRDSEKVFVLANNNAKADGLYFKKLADANTKDKADYDMWQVAKGITVTFDKNGGETDAVPGFIQVELLPDVSEYQPGVPGTNPTRDGYIFKGWNTQADGTGDTYTAETKVNRSLTVYAQWEKIAPAPTYTVTYTDGVDNEEIFADQVTSGLSAGTATPAFNGTPTRDGYTFKGWLPEVAATVTGTVTYVAQWSKNSSGGGGGGGGGTTYYILHYESNGGTEYKDERYKKNTVVELDKVPTREGYTFTGWYADEELTDRITSIKMTSDKTVYAGWEPTGVPDWLNGKDHFAYVVGYMDGTVRPLNNISRAEVATIFFRLLNEDIREENLTSVSTFADVNDGMWCNMAISTMAKLGVVKGRTAEHFDPNAPITRAEFAAICARFDTSKRDGDSNFTDISGHWAEAEIERAASLGWIMGYTDGTFRPENYITRAEAMTMINRVLNRLPEDEDDLLDGMNVWPDNKPGDWYYLAVQEATNSHDFTRKGDVYERWTKLNADPDWSQYQ